MSDEAGEKSKEGNRPLKLTRRDFLKLLAGGSALALLEACRLSPQEIENTPSVSIDELLSHPEQYTELPMVKTSGYPEQTGKKVLLIPIFRTVQIGKTTMMQVDWISTETDTYKLHSHPETDSPSVNFTVSGGMTYFPVVPLPPAGSNYVLRDEYQIVGKFTKLREQDGITENYFLQPSNVTRVETPTPLPGK